MKGQQLDAQEKILKGKKVVCVRRVPILEARHEHSHGGDCPYTSIDALRWQAFPACIDDNWHFAFI